MRTAWPMPRAPSTSGWISALLPSLESTSTGMKVSPPTSMSQTPIWPFSSLSALEETDRPEMVAVSFARPVR